MQRYYFERFTAIPDNYFPVHNALNLYQHVHAHLHKSKNLGVSTLDKLRHRALILTYMRAWKFEAANKPQWNKEEWIIQAEQRLRERHQLAHLKSQNLPTASTTSNEYVHMHIF